jgi:hypothetical protein
MSKSNGQKLANDGKASNIENEGQSTLQTLNGKNSVTAQMTVSMDNINAKSQGTSRLKSATSLSQPYLPINLHTNNHHDRQQTSDINVNSTP